MRTMTLILLPPLLSLTLAACICVDDSESSHWQGATARPKTMPVESRADGGAADAGGAADGRGSHDGVTRSDGGTVATDAGCPGGNARGDGDIGGCGMPAPVVCQFNNQCGPGGRCRNGSCERRCQSRANCGTGQACLASFCQPPGTSGGQCIYDRDCGAGHTCINGFCHADCQADTDCGAQDRCTVGVCKPDNGPQPECRASTDCPDGKMCVNAVCRAACNSDADCCIGGVIGPTCHLGYCLTAHETSPVCRVSTDCAAGLSCTDAVCD